jgi:hypothetical protein
MVGWNGSQSFSTIYALIQTYKKEKYRPPKEKMGKSDLRSPNGPKPSE